MPSTLHSVSFLAEETLIVNRSQISHEHHPTFLFLRPCFQPWQCHHDTRNPAPPIIYETLWKQKVCSPYNLVTLPDFWLPSTVPNSPNLRCLCGTSVFSAAGPVLGALRHAMLKILGLFALSEVAHRWMEFVGGWNLPGSWVSWMKNNTTRWWFQILYIFTPSWGTFPCFDEYFFKWVGSTTNQITSCSYSNSLKNIHLDFWRS